jgi:uncharacterized protein
MSKNIVELMKQEIINRSNKFEEETKGTKDEYNLYREHVQYVYKYATMIAEEKNADLEIVELSALLHDIAMTDSNLDRTKHNEYGSIIAEELLSKENYPTDRIEKVKQCILNHSSKRKEYRTTIEEQILVDADAMAHFDCIDSLYSLAHNVIGLNDKESLKFVKEKLTKDYNEISDDVKKYVSGKYSKIMK